MDKLDKYLFVVNSDKPLTPEREKWMHENFNFVPFKDEDGESFMEEQTFKAYTSLIELMKKKHHLDVDSHSAGRTVETQEKVYQQMLNKFGEEWTRDHVSMPGASEHHTGLAFDLRFKPSFVPEKLRSQMNSLSKKTGLQKKVFDLIAKEAVNFGLILRYEDNKKPITKVNGEYWHFRYVGKENAKTITEKGMCLEEYEQYLLNQKNHSDSQTKSQPEEAQPGNE